MEPKVEPYVGRGDVDLADDGEYDTPTSPGTGVDAARGGSSPVGELERETKQMLGVSTTAASPHTTEPSRSLVSPIPTKQISQSGPSRASPTQSGHPASPTGQTDTSSPISESTRPHGEPSAFTADSPSRTAQDAEIEYVRHTDGGGMRVELPPLYTDVPRRESDG